MMYQKIEYKFGDTGTLEQQYRLYNKVFHHEATAESWKRKHYSNPLQKGKSYVMCAFAGNKLVGINGFSFIQYRYNSIIIKAIESCDTAVDPEYRGQGIFSGMIQQAEIEFKKMGYDVLVGFPNDNSFPGFLKLGWEEKARIKRMFYPVNLQKIIYAKYSRKVFKLINLLSDMWQKIHSIGTVKGLRIDEGKMKSTKEYYEMINSNKIVINMDDDFMEWKLSEGYSLIKIRNNNEVVLKMLVCTYRENSYYKRGNVIAVKTITSKEKEIRSAITTCLKKMCKEFDYLTVWNGLDKKINKAFRKAGYIKDFKHKEGVPFIVKIITDDENKKRIMSERNNWFPMFIEADYVLDDYIARGSDI